VGDDRQSPLPVLREDLHLRILACGRRSAPPAAKHPLCSTTFRSSAPTRPPARRSTSGSWRRSAAHDHELRRRPRHGHDLPELLDRSRRHAGAPHKEIHICFRAQSREEVDAFVEAARSGVEVLHEPRVWPEYHPGYYGGFVRDLDGNNIETVHHTF
jgi:hypothetical protein